MSSGCKAQAAGPLPDAERLPCLPIASRLACARCRTGRILVVVWLPLRISRRRNAFPNRPSSRPPGPASGRRVRAVRAAEPATRTAVCVCEPAVLKATSGPGRHRTAALRFAPMVAPADAGQAGCLRSPRPGTGSGGPQACWARAGRVILPCL